MLESVSSIIFINDLDNGMERILSKFVDNTKLREVVSILEGRAAIQKDLDRLEKQAGSNLMKFGKSECKVPCLGRDNPMRLYYRLGAN